MTTLLLSARQTGDAQLLWRAAVARGWSVVRAQGIRVPPIEDDVAIYVEALYGPTIARSLGKRLVDPDEAWLCDLPHEYRRRSVTLTTLGDARLGPFPAFVKPPNDKSFEAAVTRSADDLPSDFTDSTPVLVAEPVRFEAEYRTFVLAGEVVAASPYLRHEVISASVGYAAPADELAEATAFASAVAADERCRVPPAIALDVGRLDTGDWAVVEANGAWGAGIYGCDADRVLDVIAAATRPAAA